MLPHVRREGRKDGGSTWVRLVSQYARSDPPIHSNDMNRPCEFRRPPIMTVHAALLVQRIQALAGDSPLIVAVRFPLDQLDALYLHTSSTARPSPRIISYTTTNLHNRATSTSSPPAPSTSSSPRGAFPRPTRTTPRCPPRIRGPPASGSPCGPRWRSALGRSRSSPATRTRTRCVGHCGECAFVGGSGAIRT